MQNRLALITKITLLVLLVVNIVALALVFLGGDGEPITVGGEELANPIFTEPFLFWIYVLVGLTLCITLGLVVYQFVISFIDNPKRGIRTVCVLAVFLAVFVISWFLGSGEKMEIIGYEGADNVGFWAQFTDMVIYSIYTLIVATIAVLLGTVIYSKVK